MTLRQSCVEQRTLRLWVGVNVNGGESLAPIEEVKGP